MTKDFSNNEFHISLGLYYIKLKLTLRYIKLFNERGLIDTSTTPGRRMWTPSD